MSTSSEPRPDTPGTSRAEPTADTTIPAAETERAPQAASDPAAGDRGDAGSGLTAGPASDPAAATPPDAGPDSALEPASDPAAAPPEDAGPHRGAGSEAETASTSLGEPPAELPEIRALDREQLRELCRRYGEPTFRATQIAEWLWKHRVHSFDRMSNLSKALRARLSREYAIRPARVQEVQESSDGSIKVAYRLPGDHRVEGVLIPAAAPRSTRADTAPEPGRPRDAGSRDAARKFPSDTGPRDAAQLQPTGTKPRPSPEPAAAGELASETAVELEDDGSGAVESVFSAGREQSGAPARLTACVSSQVGCSLRCAFCATGRGPMRRNVSAAEIVDQVDHLDRLARERYGRGLTNVVYMGMGEPLANYDEVVRSVRLLTDPAGFGMSPRRITLSTVGLAPEMHRLAEEGLAINLALSLHAATDHTRRNLMTSARSHSLAELAEAVRAWYRARGTPVTLEYLLLGGYNDDQEAARALVRFAGSLPCKVNLIEYNPVLGMPFRASDPETTERFVARLANAGITVTVRRSGGRDIDAACGQLAGRRSGGTRA